MAKDDILQESQKQLNSFKKQLEELKLKEKAETLSEDAKVIYEKQRIELEALIDETDIKFKDLSDKASEGWQETKEFVELTNKALKHSFNYFMSHYK